MFPYFKKIFSLLKEKPTCCLKLEKIDFFLILSLIFAVAKPESGKRNYIILYFEILK